MIKKISKIQIVKIITQLAFLILIPGLFTLVFGELKEIYTLFLNGNFNFVSAFTKLIEISSIALLTVILGRFFCGWMCAFGTLNDILHMISSKIFKTKFKVNKSVDSILKYAKYLVLIFIIIVMWTFGSTIFNSSSPWGAFAQMPDLSEAMSSYMIGCIILAFIAVGAMFIERFFCRYLCPLGAVFTIFSKIRIFGINKPRNDCGKCRICTEKCAMGISLYEVDKVKSGECINCLKCISACPRKNTKAALAGENITPALGSSIAIAACIGMYSVSEVFTSSVIPSSPSNVSTASPDKNTASQNMSDNSNTTIYKDGTYTGIGRGYRPSLEVVVTVKNNKIADIEIGSNNETPRYASRPFNTIPEKIIAAQSTDVDTISGATRTCKGIIMAVEDALSEAKTAASVVSNTSSTLK